MFRRLSPEFYLLVGIILFTAFAAFAPAFADGGTIGLTRAYQVPCNSTARTLAPSGVNSTKNSFKFKVTGAAVFFGGSDVDTSTKGFPYNIGDIDSYDANPGAVWCKSAGSATVTILAGGF